MDFRVGSAVVTGAASGIGRALAERLHQQGARLTLADRDGDALRRTADDLRARALTMDVSSPEDNERLAAVSGTPTLLCLNAGVVNTSPGPVWEAAPDEWRRVLDINSQWTAAVRERAQRLADGAAPVPPILSRAGST
jgi:NAD(P)-dependent dehydrogenase (short-subunit alcohol dehydrogenase family)